MFSKSYSESYVNLGAIRIELINGGTGNGGHIIRIRRRALPPHTIFNYYAFMLE